MGQSPQKRPPLAWMGSGVKAKMTQVQAPQQVVTISGNWADLFCRPKLSVENRCFRLYRVENVKMGNHANARLGGIAVSVVMIRGWGARMGERHDASLRRLATPRRWIVLDRTSQVEVSKRVASRTRGATTPTPRAPRRETITMTYIGRNFSSKIPWGGRRTEGTSGSFIGS